MVSEQLVSALLLLVKEAGGIVLQYYGNHDKGFTTKTVDAVTSPVTLADLAVNQFLSETLCALESRLPVLSEESTLPLYEERKKWDSFWVLDPLDGTKEFINQNGEFTINLALVVGNVPTLGIVHAPALNLTYHAVREKGAFKAKGDQAPAPIQVSNKPTGRLTILSSRSHPSPKLNQFLSQVPDYQLVKVGSSLKFCRVAEGTAQLYPRLGTTMEWDTAAGQCIVEAAGGTVTTLDRTTLAYNKEDLRNPDFVVSAWPELLMKGLGVDD